MRGRAIIKKVTERTKEIDHIEVSVAEIIPVEEAVAVSVAANGEVAAVTEEQVDEAEVQQGDTTMTSMCSQASVPEIS